MDPEKISETFKLQTCKNWKSIPTFYQFTVHDIFYSQILKQVFSKLQDMQLQQHVPTCTNLIFHWKNKTHFGEAEAARFELEAAEVFRPDG